VTGGRPALQEGCPGGQDNLEQNREAGRTGQHRRTLLELQASPFDQVCSLYNLNMADNPGGVFGQVIA